MSPLLEAERLTGFWVVKPLANSISEELPVSKETTSDA